MADELRNPVRSIEERVFTVGMEMYERHAEDLYLWGARAASGPRPGTGDTV
jgi:hypothetical protein